MTRYSQVQCAILCSLEAELQKRFEHHDPCELVRELKAIFETHAAVESCEASKHFFDCMMEEGSSVSEHVLAVTQHTTACCSIQVVDMIFMKGLLHKYHIPQSGTTETLQVMTLDIILQTWS